MSASWVPLGRIALWTHAIGYIVASLIFIGVVFAITAPAAPAAADGAGAVLAYRAAIWPQIMASWLIYFLAFFALVPVAYLLREVLGGDARAQLAATFVGVGGLVGIIDSLQTLSAHAAAVRKTDAATASIATIADDIASSVVFYDVGLLFLCGTGIFLAGRAARAVALLPSSWATLSLIVGAVYWFAALLNVGAALGDAATAATLTRAYQLVILVGGVVLAPLWAIWLARILGRVTRPA